MFEIAGMDPLVSEPHAGHGDGGAGLGACWITR